MVVFCDFVYESKYNEIGNKASFMLHDIKQLT